MNNFDLFVILILAYIFKKDIDANLGQRENTCSNSGEKLARCSNECCPSVILLTLNRFFSLKGLELLMKNIKSNPNLLLESILENICCISMQRSSCKPVTITVCLNLNNLPQFVGTIWD